MGSNQLRYEFGRDRIVIVKPKLKGITRMSDVTGVIIGVCVVVGVATIVALAGGIPTRVSVEPSKIEASSITIPITYRYRMKEVTFGKWIVESQPAKVHDVEIGWHRVETDDPFDEMSRDQARELIYKSMVGDAEDRLKDHIRDMPSPKQLTTESYP